MDSVGRVESVRSEVCIVSGLANVGLSNVVSFSSGGQGIVFGFERDTAQVIMFKNYEQVKKGDLVRIFQDSITTYVNEGLLGRTIDPLGNPLDGRGAIDELNGERIPIESPARPIYQRAFVDRGLETGITLIDSQIPVGRGQRELLLGERNTGQNELATSVIINQVKLQSGVISIYVAIDAESAATKRRIERLTEAGAMDNTIFIFGRTAAAASINYIAPMVGVSIAEWFAAKGHNVLIIFDDLTRHAKVYRQLSLLLDRPASREAYPGDIFYLHSRLLERCGAFNHYGGNGTVTALPIVETPTEEATDYITTNLMSITDGHILFRQALVNKGVQPAVDSGFSVSRIGGRVQRKLLREISEELKEILIRYTEIERFLAFGSDLNSESLEYYELGKRAYSVFNQTHIECRTATEQVILLYFVLSGKALEWGNEQMPDLIRQLIAFIGNAPYDKLLNDSLLITGLTEAKLVLNECLNDFTKNPKTLKPKEKGRHLVAETETISGILHENEEVYHAKN
jgi:F-type H+/Na+-transporting ATPase subunit alpha